MTPQAFVDQLNMRLMPELGYVRIDNLWLWPVSGNGIRYQLPDGRPFEYLLPDGRPYIPAKER